MSLSRFLLIAGLVTAVALTFVHQQIELLMVNYTMNRNQGNLLVLLDQNSTLLYNVDNLQSPQNLEQRLIGQKGANWEIPSGWHTIGLAEAAR